MTSERDIERVLDRWFVDRPTEVSERVLDEVADRIGRQPQQPAWRAFRRDADVNTYLKPLLAVAAVVVVVVAGFAILRPSGPPVGVPPTPDALTTTAPELPDGRLEAGDYVGRAVTGDPMAFTITSPQGWNGFGGFFIGGPNSNPSGAPDGIGISFNHDPQVTDTPCGPHEEDPAQAAPSVDDLVAALSAREDLQVSGVTDTTLAGYSGKRLDIQFPAELACVNHYVFAEPKGLYGNGPANRWRVWILDADGETALVILLDYAATPAEDRAAAEAAIDSVRINPFAPASAPSAPPSDSAAPSTAVYRWPRTLDAGTYSTRLIWEIPFELQFTVPDRWQGRDVEVFGDEVSVGFHLAGNTYSDPCGRVLMDPPTGPTIDDLADALAALPGFDATEPRPVTADGLADARFLELAVRDDAGCETPGLWADPPDSYNGEGVVGGPAWGADLPNMKVWILDVDGVRLVVSGLWSDTATQAALDQLQGVLNSVRIVPATGQPISLPTPS